MWPALPPPTIHVDPLVIAAPEFVPNTPPGTWPSAALPVGFVLALPRSRDVGADAAAELEVALRAWPRVACTAWRARYDGERAAVAADDGVNVVLFHDDAWPAELIAGAVAQTVIHTDANGRYRDADIHLNGKDFRFSLDGAAGTVDLRSVLTHELGHALGLGHSSDPIATMFPTVSGQRWRSLEKDDSDGVCSLYPGTGTSGCESAPCPAPYLCIASSCQRPKELRDVCSPCVREPGACEAAGDDARCIDIGTGAAAGRVCGRSCAGDAQCGTGFHCLATTAAGDLQCVSDVGCKNGGNVCATDADCTNSTCRNGVCVGAADAPDAGPSEGGNDAAAADASAEAGPQATPGGGGCECRLAAPGAPSSPGRAALAFLAAVVLAASVRRRTAE